MTWTDLPLARLPFWGFLSTALTLCAVTAGAQDLTREVAALSTGNVEFQFDLGELEDFICIEPVAEPRPLFRYDYPPHMAQPVVVAQGCCSKAFFDIAPILHPGARSPLAKVELGGLCTQESQEITLSCGRFTYRLSAAGEQQGGWLEADPDAPENSVIGEIAVHLQVTFEATDSAREVTLTAGLNLSLSGDVAFLDADEHPVPRPGLDLDCDGKEDEEASASPVALGWQSTPAGPKPGAICFEDRKSRMTWCASPEP